MSTIDPTSLVRLLADANDGGAYSGTFQWTRNEGDLVTWKVWRRDRLARIEEADGRLTLIAGDDFYWTPDADSDLGHLWPRRRDSVELEMCVLSMLEADGYWSEWLSQDWPLVMSTLRATTHEGRPAWRFTAPKVKGACPELTVDQELGLVLEIRHPKHEGPERWSNVVVGDVPGAAFEFPSGEREG